MLSSKALICYCIKEKSGGPLANLVKEIDAIMSQLDPTFLHNLSRRISLKAKNGQEQKSGPFPFFFAASVQSRWREFKMHFDATLSTFLSSGFSLSSVDLLADCIFN